MIENDNECTRRTIMEQYIYNQDNGLWHDPLRKIQNQV